jgi:uncharacterized protein YbjT (DUF2867 family)
VKRPLVCGAGGFLGRHLVKKLRALDLEAGLAMTYPWVESQVKAARAGAR